MSMPSIDDVKAAISLISEVDHERLEGTVFEFAYGCDEERFQRSAATLMRFALAILSAPGMSVERLAEIQWHEQAATPGPWEGGNSYLHNGDDIVVSAGNRLSQSDGEFCGFARQAVPELLAEVLRLRALTANPLVVPQLTEGERDQFWQDWARVYHGPQATEVIHVGIDFGDAPQQFVITDIQEP